MADSPSFSVKSASKKAPNLSGGWIVMVLAGLIAAVIFFVATAQGSKKTDVLVAARNIQPGQTVDASSFRTVSIGLDKSENNRVIKATELSSITGYIAAGPIASGDYISRNQLNSPSTKNGQRAMSIAVPKSRAVNGQLRVGDRIDFLDNKSGQIRAADIEIIGVDAGSSGGGIASSGGGFTLTISVSPDQASTIGKLLIDDKFSVLRATGAPVYDLGSSASTESSTSTSTSAPPA